MIFKGMGVSSAGFKERELSFIDRDGYSNIIL
jgi:hypothetical protein